MKHPAAVQAAAWISGLAPRAGPEFVLAAPAALAGTAWIEFLNLMGSAE